MESTGRFIVFVAAAATVLAGCGGTPEPARPSAGASPSPATQPGPAAPPARGELIAREGALSFRPCGAPESQAIPLSGATAELRDAAGGAYVELRGATAADGKSFTIDSVVRLRPKGADPVCGTPVLDGDFEGSGSEPFWAVQIGRESIVFRSADEPKGRAYPYSAMRTAQGTIVYAAKLEKPKVRTLAVTIAPGRCVDGMSGELRGFKARVELDGRTLTGCASAGVPSGGFGDDPLAELARWAGADPRASGLWSWPVLESRLAALAGPRLPEIRAGMKDSGPLMRDGELFYVLGGDGAALVADPGTDTIEIILLDKGGRSDLKEGDRDVRLPAEVEAFLAKRAR